jgi:hypothetical protein
MYFGGSLAPFNQTEGHSWLMGICKLQLKRQILFIKETKQNCVKTESEGLRKLLVNTVNFCESFGQNLTNFHPFFMAGMKVSKIQPVFNKFSKYFGQYLA